MPSDNNRNMYLAMALSLLVLVGWNYFYGAPQLDRQRQTAAQQQNPAAPPQPAGAPVTVAVPDTPNAAPANPSAAAEVARSRDEALAESPRIPLETRDLKGSIALKGARLDDVSLKGYRETTDPKSPIITLLSPSNAPAPYYAELGFVAKPGDALALPGRDTLWTAEGTMLTAERPLALTWDNGQGLVFHRVVSVDDQYMFTVKDTVENKGANAVTLFPYSLISRHGKPPVSGYSVLHEGLVGVIGDSRVQELTYDAVDKETKAQRTLEGTGGWIGITDKYWAATVIPDQGVAYKGRFSSTGTTVKTYQTDVLEDAQTVQPGASLDVTTRVFAGAKENDTIDKYQANYSIRNFDLLIDWGWFYFITKPLFRVMDFFYKITGNFGLAILIVTVLIKAIFFPLANRSYMSMAKMKNVQPQLAALRERHPDDKAKQQSEMMELYKREKINPVAGCLPMLVQVPVFFALYKVIFITIEMRQAPFYGWLNDLSAPDPTNVFTLFGLIPVALPPILHLGLLPLIMGFSMFVQMKMNPEPPDPVQKQMFSWMPVIFTFMLGSFPSGLVLYWTWNNTLSVIQQYLIMRKAGAKVELWDNLRGTFGRRKTDVALAGKPDVKRNPAE